MNVEINLWFQKCLYETAKKIAVEHFKKTIKDFTYVEHITHRFDRDERDSEDPSSFGWAWEFQGNSKDDLYSYNEEWRMSVTVGQALKRLIGE